MSKQPGRLTAQVFLHSVSGRSLRSLGQEPLPEDLTPFCATEKTRQAARRILEDLGFETHVDDLGMTISIAGSPTLFGRVFGEEKTPLRAPAATETVTLAPPPALEPLVEAIVLSPEPEFHR